MADLVLGPVLRYVGDTQATVWVETDGPCEVEVLGTRERTFHLSGHHYALVRCTLTYRRWRANAPDTPQLPVLGRAILLTAALPAASVGGNPLGPRFSALVLSAEYVFYWNVLSHSMFLRLLNARPVFLFDRGHLVRNVTPLYERIIEWYYQGWQPIYLDPAQDLTAQPLDYLAGEYRDAAREIGTLMQRSPLPDQMIEELSRAEKGVPSEVSR